MNSNLRFMTSLAILTMATSAFGQRPADDDFPALPSSLSLLSRSRNSVDETADPFRRSGEPRGIGRYHTGNVSFSRQSRDRLPVDGLVDSDRSRNVTDDFRAYPGFEDRWSDRLTPVLPVRFDEPRSDRLRLSDIRREDDVRPDLNSRSNRVRYSDDRDPFIPAPLPDSQIDDESSKIDELITVRYQNPVNVRAIRAMSTSQAVSLFSEVSQKIDERSLEPTSYDARVRRALRNLTIALDNSAFVNGLGISADSFALDGFRNTLARLADAGQIRNYQEARSVLNNVMAAASRVSGLTPSVVGFEFANASIDTLDKFSGLEPTDPSDRNGAELSGQKSAALEEEIVGVGVEVREHADGLLVVKPLRGGPAAEAGVETGDIILSINGRGIGGMKMASSVDLMKGTSGSQMKVRIYREGRGERDFMMTRRKVRVWTVNDAKLLSGTNVGYFSLSRFSQSSTAEIDQALNDLHNKGMKSLVIDLRGNPGGLLTTCIEVSDRFLACGTIVSTKGRLSGDNMVEQATYAKTWNVPLVVLVDGDSASASEIFAAAIQENERGVVVGTKSYGKGSVQTHFPLNSISGDLRLTTALFYSPSGRPMADKGVTPDVEIRDRDGLANGDEVLIEALRIAQSQTLKNMAAAAGKCRTNTPSVNRSSSLSHILDPSHIGTEVR
ncbi:MAG: S41 family peptidase [Planctomycetota bacterium]